MKAGIHDRSKSARQVAMAFGVLGDALLKAWTVDGVTISTLPRGGAVGVAREPGKTVVRSRAAKRGAAASSSYKLRVAGPGQFELVEKARSAKKRSPGSEASA